MLYLPYLKGHKARTGDFQVGNKDDQIKIRKMVGLLPENAGLYDDLSAYENLDFYGGDIKCRKRKGRKISNVSSKMLDLWDRRS